MTTFIGTIQFARGMASRLAVGVAAALQGSPLYLLDSHQLYMANGDGTATLIGPYVPPAPAPPPTLTGGGDIADAANVYTYYLDTTASGSYTLFPTTGGGNVYDFKNLGPNPLTLSGGGADTIDGQISVTMPPLAAYSLGDRSPGYWSILMAYLPNSYTGRAAVVPVAATLAVSAMPSGPTDYEVDTTSAAVTLTLPPAGGQNVPLKVNWIKGANALTIALNGTDTIDTPIPTAASGVLVLGSSLTFASNASGNWILS